MSEHTPGADHEEQPVHVLALGAGEVGGLTEDPLVVHADKGRERAVDEVVAEARPDLERRPPGPGEAPLKPTPFRLNSPVSMVTGSTVRRYSPAAAVIGRVAAARAIRLALRPWMRCILRCSPG